MNNDIFCFTEIINCGKIGKIMLESFAKYHPNLIINVFGKFGDFTWITNSSNIILHDIENDIASSFNQGHLGTAKLWAKLIKERSEKYLLHIDSDVVFRGNIVDTVIEKINEGYDLIGAVRNYKNNLCHVDNVRHLRDTVATACFAFNKELIKKDYDHETLINMCRGTCTPHGHPVLDFFDPVSFDILYNDGKIWFLDFNEVGGCNNQGSRDNDFKEYNNMDTAFKIEFGSKMAHFSAVGSGMNFYNNTQKTASVPDSYKKYAIDRYALFCKIFYDEYLPDINVNQYEKLFSGIEWF